MRPSQVERQPAPPPQVPTVVALVRNMANGDLVPGLGVRVLRSREDPERDTLQDETATADAEGRVTLVQPATIRELAPVGPRWRIAPRSRSSALLDGTIWVFELVELQGRVLGDRGNAVLDVKSVTVAFQVASDEKVDPRSATGLADYNSKAPNSPWSYRVAERLGMQGYATLRGVMDDGSFSIRVPRTRSGVVLVQAHGWFPAMADVPETVGEVIDLGTITLHLGHVVRGAVIASDGAKMTGGRVRVYVTTHSPLASVQLDKLSLLAPASVVSGGADWQVRHLILSVPIRSDGSFEANLPAPGSVRILADAHGYVSSNDQFEPHGAATSRDAYRLERFSGSMVVLANGGVPIAGWTYLIGDTTDADDRYAPQPAVDGKVDSKGRIPGEILVTGRKYHLVLTPSKAAAANGARGIVAILPKWQPSDFIELTSLEWK